MKKELTEQAAERCTSVVPVGPQGSQLVAAPVTLLKSGEIEKYHTSLMGKLEDAIRQYEHACAEKQLLEENVKIKEEENKKLKYELDSLKQN